MGRWSIIGIATAFAVGFLRHDAFAAEAPLSMEQARCRSALARGVIKLTDAILKEQGKCHQQRLQGLLVDTVDCNDPATSPFPEKIEAAAQKLVKLSYKCSRTPASPADYGYHWCPAPCDALPIGSYDDLTSCFRCFAEARAQDALGEIYGTPPVPSAGTQSGCQDTVGMTLRKYVVKRLKTQRKCQFRRDLTPEWADCRALNFSMGDVNKRGECDSATLTELDSCADDTGLEQSCVYAAGVEIDDALFDMVYFPVQPTPSPTSSPTPSSTATPIPTNTPTSLPTATPTFTATATPVIVVNLTAYRPKSEGYGSPFDRQAVAEAVEMNPGAGIRFNGDDDNGNSVPDVIDSSVSAENDLIELVLSVSPATAPPGYEYVLRRTTPMVKVWQGATKTSAILNGNDEQVLTVAGGSQSVWAEAVSGGSADLQLQVRLAGGGAVTGSDAVKVFTFTSIVIALGGENQEPSDPPNSGHGIFNIAADLYAEAYDVHMYDEDDVSGSGSGPVYNEVVRAIQSRGIGLVAIFGYSHGGGSTHDLAERLNDNRASIGTFTFPYTAYIDGIKNSSDIDVFSEDRLPPATQYHVNYYQRNDLFIRGDSVSGADVDVNTHSSTHSGVDDISWVRTGVHDPLIARVNR